MLWEHSISVTLDIGYVQFRGLGIGQSCVSRHQPSIHLGYKKLCYKSFESSRATYSNIKILSLRTCVLISEYMSLFLNSIIVCTKVVCSCVGVAERKLVSRPEALSFENYCVGTHNLINC